MYGNRAEKALIPLPPTGFASLFCAKAGRVQIKAAPKPVEGAVRHFAISPSARFCKEVQRFCAAPKASRVGSRSLEAPICKETSFENKGLIEFLISQ
jgi:hypothetical protein